MPRQVEKLPFGKIVIFALGQFGWSLASWATANAVITFFLPPEKMQGLRLFPTFIFEKAVFFTFTIVGLIIFLGRIFDAITDPLVANMSDRCTSSFGRRRVFLAISAIPTALFAFLVFVPIGDGSTIAGQNLNALWLAVTMTMFYWFITMYITPYNSLISELGHTPNERLTIATVISITWALGFALGNYIWIFRDLFWAGDIQANMAAIQSFKDAPDFSLLPAGAEFVKLNNGDVFTMICNVGDKSRFLQVVSDFKESMGAIQLPGEVSAIKLSDPDILALVNPTVFYQIATKAFQLAIGLFSAVAAVFMLLPVVFIDERRYAESHVSKDSMFQAIKSTFSNRDFKWFVLSDLPYWIAQSFMQLGITYFVVTLLGQSESLTSNLMMVMFVLSFIFYIPINLLAKRVGKKPMLVLAFAVFAVVFFFAFMLGWLPFPPVIQAWLLVILASFPIAIFGIIPNAIVADLAESHGIDTGDYKVGVFFGAHTFMMKLGIATANLLFPSLLLLGKSQENPLGIRLAGLVAMAFCLIGLVLFSKYNEKNVLKILARKEELSEREKQMLETSK